MSRIDDLPLAMVLRRGRRSLRRMTPLQRAIFIGVGIEAQAYADLARRHDLSIDEVEAEFAAALCLFLQRTNPNHGGGACRTASDRQATPGGLPSRDRSYRVSI